MFTKFTIESAQHAKQIADYLERRAEKQEELAVIDGKLEELGVKFSEDDFVATVTVGPVEPTQKRKRGRPAGVTTPQPGSGPQPQTTGRVPLEKLLMGFIIQTRVGLTLSELVDMAINSGYSSKAQDFPNMVQQALHRMMKKNVLIRDEQMRYRSAA